MFENYSSILENSISHILIDLNDSSKIHKEIISKTIFLRPFIVGNKILSLYLIDTFNYIMSDFERACIYNSNSQFNEVIFSIEKFSNNYKTCSSPWLLGAIISLDFNQDLFMTFFNKALKVNPNDYFLYNIALNSNIDHLKDNALNKLAKISFIR